MRFLRAASASILRARFSLSAVSSSTELDAVFTSIPSLRRRSMTSWLSIPRSRASWKTLTFPIRLPSLARVFAGEAQITLGLRDRFFRGCGLLFCGLLFRGLLLSRLLIGVALVPVRAGRGGRLADLLDGLLADSLDGQE